MFSRAIATFTLALPVLAAANGLEARDVCNTGAVQCCNTLTSNTAANLGDVLAGAGLLGISLSATIGGITGLVGVTCTPLSIVSLGGNSCSTQPVCCTNNYIGGAVQAGCTPVNVNL